VQPRSPTSVEPDAGAAGCASMCQLALAVDGSDV
jgi:hypothetical protein